MKRIWNEVARCWTVPVADLDALVAAARLEEAQKGKAMRDAILTALAPFARVFTALAGAEAFVPAPPPPRDPEPEGSRADFLELVELMQAEQAAIQSDCDALDDPFADEPPSIENWPPFRLKR